MRDLFRPVDSAPRATRLPRERCPAAMLAVLRFCLMCLVVFASGPCPQHGGFYTRDLFVCPGGSAPTRGPTLEGSSAALQSLF
eukprot:2214697-Pyramimonas_sp.AAC.1